MKILVFDWHTGGHHDVYLRRVAEALSGFCDVVIAAPDATADRCEETGIEAVPLGEGRPTMRHRVEDRQLARQEVTLFARAIDVSSADAALHLYADPIVEELAGSGRLQVPTLITVFYARLHYPWTYRSSLPPRDMARALVLERAVRKWRRRPDAHAVFTLDPSVVRRWASEAGAPAYWLPEPPPLQYYPTQPETRDGCILYGALAARKGVDRLARALSEDSRGTTVVLAGPVESTYGEELAGHVRRIEAGGAEVELRPWAHEEDDGLALLAAARCAVLPYHRHCGMSRVLVEAATVGTPVLVHDHGLVAALVKEHGLGAAIDCDDAVSFRRTLARLCSDEELDKRQPALRAFAQRYAPDRFAEALRAPLERLLSSAPSVIEALA